MASTATQILDVIAPQYKTDQDKDTFLVLARGQTSTCYYGTNTELAVALRAAHMMALRDLGKATGGSGGQLASKREGDLAVAFHKSGDGKGSSDLDQTSFGTQLKGLTKSSGMAISVTGIGDEGCPGS
jgi:hypothetical protein